METETNSSRASLSDAYEASSNSSIFPHPDPLTALDEIVDLRQRLENIEHLLAIPSSASPMVASKITTVGRHCSEKDVSILATDGCAILGQVIITAS